MMIRLSENAGMAVLVLGLAAVLLALGVLQYRSSLQVSEATSEQMQASLRGSLMDMRMALERELTLICRDLQVRDTDSDMEIMTQLGGRVEQWRRAASHPELVSSVFVWQADAGHHQGLQLDPASGDFEKSNLPAQFEPLRQQLLQMSEFPSPPRGMLKPSFAPGSPAAIPPPQDSEFWMIDENIPALVHRVVKPGAAHPRHKAPAVTWIIVELNLQVLSQQILPELSQRYFGGKGGLVYQVAVLRGDAQPSVLYASGPGFANDAGTTPDASLTLFGPPMPMGGGLALAPPAGGRAGTGFRPMRSANGIGRLEPLRNSNDGDWKVVARHREGSVEAAVAGMRRRNLALNFGILLVLAVTMGLIVVASLRARKLAQLQMDFVANVSHELRTPLTGILSAAQNIADGVVDSPHQFTRYGSAIAGQAQQLSDLVEQILLFSATQKDRHRYNFETLPVSRLVDKAVSSLAATIHSSGFVVEKQIAPDLPQVRVDAKAFAQSLQNLIANAVKYGGEARWIGISASLETSSPQPEVAITVADRGIGVAASELSHIFEPFYRSPSVTSAQIHGSGLGLPLAKSMVRAMGGRLTAKSSPGNGSAFTIHLPPAGGIAEDSLATVTAKSDS